MKNITLAAILCILSLPALSATSFTKEASYCPVSMSYASLGDLIEGVRTLVKSADPSESVYFRESISIESRSIKVDLKSGFSREELLNGPSKGTSVRYNMSLDDNRAISDVTLYLTDHNREVTVTGNSKNHVNAILSLVSSKLEDTGCSLGGTSHRLYGGIFILVFAAILGLLPSMGLKLSSRGSMINVSIMILLYILLWTPDWENIFPGTLITIGEESFYDRNSSTIGVAGLAIGIISIFISVYFGLVNNGTDYDQIESSDSDDQA